MNVERLHAIALSVKADFEKTQVVQLLQTIVSSLQNQINSPAEPSYQQSVSTSRESLREALSRSLVNDFPPTWRQVLEEIGAAEVSGEILKIKVEEIFSRNQITPAVAHRELQALLNDIQRVSASVDQTITAFTGLGIGAEDLYAGQCEVGVLVPRSYVDNRLDSFAKELKELNQIFGAFSELAIGSRPGFEIRTIASTDLSVFLDTAPAVGACISIAIERIVTVYQKLLEIKKLQGELAKQGLEKKNLQGIEDHANKVMENEIDRVVKDLIKEFRPGTQNERIEELSVDLKFSLKRIANRIDRGFNIEVRMAESDAIADEEANVMDAAQEAENKKYRERINSAATRMQFIRVGGDPILSLPEQKLEADKSLAPSASVAKKRPAAKKTSNS